LSTPALIPAEQVYDGRELCQPLDADPGGTEHHPGAVALIEHPVR
jgi:hypothetical protein